MPTRSDRTLYFLTTLLSVFLFSSQPLLAEEKTGSVDEKAYRGWGYLVKRLEERGVPVDTLKAIYLDKNMPRFDRLYYSVNPKEPSRIYQQFLNPKRLAKAQNYMQEHRTWFQQASKEFGLPEGIIGSILLVETNFGSYTGNYSVIHRLSRLANAASPTNVKNNYSRLLKQGEDVTFEKVAERGNYLFDLFVPEIEATIHISKEGKFPVFHMKGSPAGAFGIPQFLPSSYLKFGIDGDADGRVSLFQHPDAIMSVANYLSSHIESETPSREDLAKAVWKYNNSQAYVDAVLAVAEKLEGRPLDSFRGEPAKSRLQPKIEVASSQLSPSPTNRQ